MVVPHRERINKKICRKRPLEFHLSKLKASRQVCKYVTDSASAPCSQTGKYPAHGFVIRLITCLVAVAAGDFLVYQSWEWSFPAFGLSLFILVLAVLALLNSSPYGVTRFQRICFYLLFPCVAQSMRFYSFSCFASACALTLLIASAHRQAQLPERWTAWMEGVLAFFRPLGVVRAQLEAGRSDDDDSSGRIRRRILAGLTALILLIVFGYFLSLGNTFVEEVRDFFVSLVETLLMGLEFPGFWQIVFWLFVAYLALALIFPPRETRLSDFLSGTWRELRTRDMGLRRMQWIWSLVALNVLFFSANLTDFILWMVGGLPDGTVYSSYLHQGVGSLIFTTILSGALMALLTQHSEVIRKARFIRALCFLWIGQNMFLLLCCYWRLALYVAAYGFTPKRVEVAMFLVLVLGGFLLLTRALSRDLGIKWLLGRSIMLVFGYFFIVQFVNVDGIVVSQNLRLYRQGRIGYSPQWRLGSSQIPLCVAVLENADSPEKDRRRAADTLCGQNPDKYYLHWDWRCSSSVEDDNYSLLTEYLAAHPEVRKKSYVR